MSKTYIGALLQFLVSIGFLSQVEMHAISEFILAFTAFIPLLMTLYGRFTAELPVNIFGFRKE